MAKLKGCCYSCLNNGHIVKDCRHRRVCGIGVCKRRHHPSLHSTPELEDTQKRKVSHGVRDRAEEVSSGVIPILLSGPKGTIMVYALLDSGANTTLIRKDIAMEAGIEGLSTEIRINTISGESSITAEKCDFLVKAVDSSEEVEVKGAFAVEELPIRIRADYMDNISKR